MGGAVENRRTDRRCIFRVGVGDRAICTRQGGEASHDEESVNRTGRPFIAPVVQQYFIST